MASLLQRQDAGSIPDPASELKDPTLLQQLGSDPWPKNSKLHLLQGPAAKKREEEKKKKKLS